ncbi:choice-of-anchor I family protein [Nocardiopsis sp. NRRL B-16309]|uniref:choice-of-anchor I family protein n=1 Tax=Nocardiopsis sp. NRRL B-16309 TaxID=1519494 RepID=UPI0006AE7C12|nr:choice-of-anchor I family protein [Nocardiopsis sp. NRRL B-16309]KOX08803.1 alkaline phosphatase [Nocardiopsis sp. NRRL B-16309]
MRKTMAVTAAVAVTLTGAASIAHADPGHGRGHGHGHGHGRGPVGIELSVLGTHHSDVFDASAAEIVAHDPHTQRLFVVSAASATVEVLDVSDPEAPVKLFDLETAGATAADGSTIGGGAVANSVAVRDGVVAVAVKSTVRTESGWVVFFDVEGAVLNALRVGALPDMAAFGPDGGPLLVANEGEPNDDYTIDPEGSVSVIRMSGDPADLSQDDVSTADFRDWDGDRELHPDVRVHGPDLSTGEPGTPGRVARNLEPEYVSAVDDGTAYVVLQEANAFAVLDVESASFTDIVPFGTKDHLEPGNGFDASNRDDEIRIENWPVQGMYQPDGFDTYSWRGRTLLVTANEGDSRGWDGYSDESRVADLTEDTPLCEDSPRLAGFLEDNDQGIGTVEELTDETNLGRLHVSVEDGLRADGSCYEDLYSYGGRSFSVWTADGEQLFDSGSDFERITAEVEPEFFNSNNDDSSFDARSDDKGPEPEAVVVGKVSGRTYAFVGLERVGGVMVYDVTDPRSASFVQYLNNRDFAAEPDTRAAGGLGPEGLAFIEAGDSPVPGVPVLAVAHEVSGTTTLFRVDRMVPGRG